MKEVDEEDDDTIGLDMLFEPSAESEIEVSQVCLEDTSEDNFKEVEMTGVKGMSCLEKCINRSIYIYI